MRRPPRDQPTRAALIAEATRAVRSRALREGVTGGPEVDRAIAAVTDVISRCGLGRLT